MLGTIHRSTRCIDGRLMRHDPQPDDPYLETDIGCCLDCGGRGCELPEVTGVQRTTQFSNAVLVTFTKSLTDDEMRDFHEYVKEWTQ